MSKIVECVPNFSEGRDREVIEAIAATVSGTEGVTLLHVDASIDANRTVVTFVGPPDAVVEAAVRAAHTAAARIDMSRHTGEHPRIGAMDVCPLVPVAGVTLGECVALARRVGERIGVELAVPVFFYAAAATSEARRALARVRAGEYEGLARRLADPRWAPDCGPARFDQRFGAVAVGARGFLIAYNVTLGTSDRTIASRIAGRIRESGQLVRDDRGAIVRDADGGVRRVAGRLRGVRALGWYLAERGQAQVSTNITSYALTPIHVVFESVKAEASGLGVGVVGSEIVGLTPLAPLLEAGRFYRGMGGLSEVASESALVETAVRSLGLDHAAPFEPTKRIIDYLVGAPSASSARAMRS